MSIDEFRDDDKGYQAWLAAHPDGYVINIRRDKNPIDARVHHAECSELAKQIRRRVPLTKTYVKICAETRSEAEQLEVDRLGKLVKACGTCHRSAGIQLPPSARVSMGEASAASTLIANDFEIQGPDEGTVTAWARDYVRFEAQHRPDWQKTLAAEIKTRTVGLEPDTGQVLKATYFGEKKDNADVENLVLYYIGSFGKTGRNGIRFEHGAAAPLAPSGTEYPYCYNYQLVSQEDGFSDWQSGKKLASFDWIDLGEFKGDKLAAPTWLATARAYESGQAEVFHSNFKPGTQFAVKVQIRPPDKHTRMLGNLVKGIFDGVVCAFQSHTDMGVLGQIVPPIATAIQAASPALQADPAEIERYLREQGRGVLGELPQLIRPASNGGVIFSPDDHLCVTGELLRVDPPGDLHWSIRGDVVALSPRQVG